MQFACGLFGYDVNPRAKTNLVVMKIVPSVAYAVNDMSFSFAPII